MNISELKSEFKKAPGLKLDNSLMKELKRKTEKVDPHSIVTLMCKHLSALTAYTECGTDWRDPQCKS